MKVYLLYHKRWIDDQYYDTKMIGIYSSYEIVQKTINKFSLLPGFSDFTTGFHFETANIPVMIFKKKKYVYLLEGMHVIDSDEIAISFRVYTNKIFAIINWILGSILKKEKLGTKFYIDRYLINEDNWKEGFVIAPDI